MSYCRCCKGIPCAARLILDAPAESARHKQLSLSWCRVGPGIERKQTNRSPKLAGSHLQKRVLEESVVSCSSGVDHLCAATLGQPSTMTGIAHASLAPLLRNGAKRETAVALNMSESYKARNTPFFFQNSWMQCSRLTSHEAKKAGSQWVRNDSKGNCMNMTL